MIAFTNPENPLASIKHRMTSHHKLSIHEVNGCTWSQESSGWGWLGSKDVSQIDRIMLTHGWVRAVNLRGTIISYSLVTQLTCETPLEPQRLSVKMWEGYKNRQNGVRW
jgi:hypothetical protein